MPEPEIRHTTSAQPTRNDQISRADERASDGWAASQNGAFPKAITLTDLAHNSHTGTTSPHTDFRIEVKASQPSGWPTNRELLTLPARPTSIIIVGILRMARSGDRSDLLAA